MSLVNRLQFVLQLNYFLMDTLIALASLNIEKYFQPHLQSPCNELLSGKVNFAADD